MNDIVDSVRKLKRVYQAPKDTDITIIEMHMDEFDEIFDYIDQLEKSIKWLVQCGGNYGDMLAERLHSES